MNKEEEIKYYKRVFEKLFIENRSNFKYPTLSELLVNKIYLIIKFINEEEIIVEWIKLIEKSHKFKQNKVEDDDGNLYNELLSSCIGKEDASEYKSVVIHELAHLILLLNFDYKIKSMHISKKTRGQSYVKYLKTKKENPCVELMILMSGTLAQKYYIENNLNKENIALSKFGKLESYCNWKNKLTLDSRSDRWKVKKILKNSNSDEENVKEKTLSILKENWSLILFLYKKIINFDKKRVDFKFDEILKWINEY